MKEKLTYIIGFICAIVITIVSFLIIIPTILKLMIQDFIRYIFIKTRYK